MDVHQSHGQHFKYVNLVFAIVLLPSNGHQKQTLTFDLTIKGPLFVLVIVT